MNAATTQTHELHYTDGVHAGEMPLPKFNGEWEKKRLEDIASIRNRRVLASSVSPDTLCVELDHIASGDGRLLKHATAENSTSSKYRFCAGDILFGRLRSYLRKHWHADRDGICTTEIWPLMVNPAQVDSAFLYAIVQSEQFIAMSSVSYGTHMPRTDWGVMRNLEVVLPKIEEQRAIGEVLSDVNGLIGALDALIAKKRAIKQATMQQLLAGKTRLPGYSGAWGESKQVGELAYLIPSGIYGLEKQTGQLTGMPVATTAHIDLNDRWNEKQMDVRYFTEGQIDHYSPLEGDLIVVKSSGSAASIQSGKVGYVSADKVRSFIFSNFLMLLRPTGCNAQFLFFQLTSARVKQMLPRLVEASTYPNLRLNDYMEVKIPLPPPEEQLAIVNVLSDMGAEIAALENRRDKTIAIKQGMMQQLLPGKVRLLKSTNQETL